jgi:catecholate siderophore receptor
MHQFDPTFSASEKTDTPRKHNALLPLGFLLLAASFQAPAQPASTGEFVGTLGTVEVIDFRGAQMSSPKYARDLQETPRLITILPSDLLQEQGVISLKDALKNIPGISLQVGEGNPPAGDQFKLRGFNARDDIKLNGVRDPGNYFRDPFYVDQIEVVKGPNSALAGRGSAGGTVNLVTKQPTDRDFNQLDVTLGTDNFYRATVDINKRLSDMSAVRLNLLAHKADLPGRDIAKEERYGLYAAYTWGLKGATRITADFLYLRLDDLQDAGLPTDRNNLLGTLNGIKTRIAPGARYSNFYGHLDDRKKVDVNQFGINIQHTFQSGLTLKNQLRLSQVHNDGWVSSPRITTGNIDGQPNDGITTSCSVDNPCARGETKPRDQKDTVFNNQLDLLFSFKTGAITHDLILGFELSQNKYENKRRRDTRGPWTSLYNPTPRFLGSFQVINNTLFGVPVYDGTVYTLKTRETAFYIQDTIALTPKLDLYAGLRQDNVKATATRRGFDGTNAPVTNNTTHERKDNELSYNLGLVYKITPVTSIYVIFGNAYVMSANFDRNSVQLAGGAAAEAIVGRGFDTPPEKMKSYELGFKTTLAKGLDLGAAVFRTDVANGRLPGQSPGVTGLPDNKYYIDGFELLAAGKITDRWQLYAGYTYLTNKITAAPGAGADEAYVKSQKLGGTPRHSANLFTLYNVTPRITVGGGLKYVDSVTSGIDPIANDNVYTVRIPGFTVVDLYAAYRFSPRAQVRLNLNNAFDKKYIAQLAEGGSQGLPGSARQLLVTLRYDF